MPLGRKGRSSFGLAGLCAISWKAIWRPLRGDGDVVPFIPFSPAASYPSLPHVLYKAGTTCLPLTHYTQELKLSSKHFGYYRRMPSEIFTVSEGVFVEEFRKQASSEAGYSDTPTKGARPPPDGLKARPPVVCPTEFRPEDGELRSDRISRTTCLPVFRVRICAFPIVPTKPTGNAQP